jgi:hypothetical protein
MAIIGNTQTTATKQAAIASVAQKELKESSNLLAYFTDVSQFAVKGAKSISFPKLTSFSVSSRATGTAGTPAVVTSSVDTMDLDIKNYVSWVIDPNDEVQSTLDWELATVGLAASAHGRGMNESLITALKACRKQIAVAADISKANILEMREYLKKNNADMSKVVLFVAADQMTALLGISEFTQNQIYGSAPVENGLIGRVYGIPVIETNFLSDGEYIMAEKSGCAYGFQKGPQYGEQPANEYGVGALLRAMDLLAGIKGLQINVGTAGASESALVVGFKDAA